MQQAVTTLAPIHPEWRKLLAESGAVFENNCVLHFGNPETERRKAADSDILADLSHLAVLRAEGADTQHFLQGQLSNDIRLVSTARAQLSAYCNAKGRMSAIFLIFQGADGAFYLQLPAALTESTLKRLRMFILRSKVKIDVAENSFAHIGLSGPNAELLLKNEIGNIPTEIYGQISSNEITVIRLPGPHARFELFATLKHLTSLWQRLAANALPVGAGPWSWLDIMAGTPVILPGTVEEFVPQMTNLELVGGVSFNKGCYPGQEIVARMHYLGRLKQRMFRAHVETEQSPQPGNPIYATDMPDQSAGSVVSAEPAPNGGYDLLAVIQLTSAQSAVLHLNGAHGPLLHLADLPYPLPTAS